VGTVEPRRLLADHEGYPLSICRHPALVEPTVTAAAVVYDCGARVASIALGNPCTAVFLDVRVLIG
jgi:hypothetical protein